VGVDNVLGSEHRRVEIAALQFDRQLVAGHAGLGQLVEAAPETRAGFLQLPGMVLDPTKLKEHSGPRLGAHRQLGGSVQVRYRLRPPGSCLRSPQLGKHGRSRSGRGRFSDGALEIIDRGRGHALSECALRRGAQAVHDEPIAERGRLQQVGTHLFITGAGTGQHLRCPAVCCGAGVLRQAAVDGGAQQWVNEPERVPAAEHVFPHQFGRSRTCIRRLQRRELSSEVQGDVDLEHGDRLGKCPRLCGDGVEPANDGALQRTSRSRGPRLQRRLVAGLLRSLKSDQELPELERVPSSELEAAPSERLVRTLDAPLHKVAHRGRPERTQAVDARTIRGQDLHQPTGTRFVLPRSNEYADGCVGDTAHQVDEETKRGLIGPLGVVHHDQNGPGLRQTQREPVQAVHDRETSVGRRHQARERLTVEDLPRRRRRSVQQAFTLDCLTTEQPALEERAPDTPAERLLQLVPASP
jgi:hypothetical protein